MNGGHDRQVVHDLLGGLRLARAAVAADDDALRALGDEQGAVGVGGHAEDVRLEGEAEARAGGPVWGDGAGTPKDPGPFEGELRNMWKPTAVDGLWFQAGNFAESRHYSRFLALQLQARWLSLQTPVYDPNARALMSNQSS